MTGWGALTMTGGFLVVVVLLVARWLSGEDGL